MSNHTVHDRFQVREAGIFWEVDDTHTLGIRPGTYRVRATCTSYADAVLIRDLLNKFYKGE